MNHFRATHIATGEVVEYDATLPQPEHLTDGWRLENISQASSAPDPEAPPATTEPMTWTKLEYLRRFTQVERIAIRGAAKVSPELEDYVALLELASDVCSDDPDIVGALTMLEAVGLIGAGRAQEILNAQ
jgi:hypothetical protein